MPKRKNKRIEKQFVEEFKERILNVSNVKIENVNCSAKKMADIQYEKDGIFWLIEAKTSKSPDKYNAVHKLFGELLKLTSFSKGNNSIKYGLLLNEKEYFRNQIKKIPSEKLIAFGDIIPVSAVFIFDGEKCNQLTWAEFIY